MENGERERKRENTRRDEIGAREIEGLVDEEELLLGTEG
jgi:hypothetical protein